MNHVAKGLSTGPKTVEGKAVSSQNARKDSIFVQGYLPWENQEEKQLQFTAMAKQWGAKDPSRLMILRTLEQTQLGIERMMYIERKKIEGLMQSTLIATEFCERAGMPRVSARSLPDWFFLDEGTAERKRALVVARIYDEAADLKENYSEHKVSRVKEEYPALHAHVMQGQKEGASFLIVLGRTYSQSVPTLNLATLMNKLIENYQHHLLWAQAPARYQAIIDGLRAEQIERAIDMDKSQRYATNLQNRMMKGFSALAALDQHEALMKNQKQPAVQVESDTNLTLEMASKESAPPNPDSEHH